MFEGTLIVMRLDKQNENYQSKNTVKYRNVSRAL